MAYSDVEVWFGSKGQEYAVVVKASQEEVPNECTKEHSVDEQYRRILHLAKTS